MNVSSVFSRPSRSGCKGNTLFESRKPFWKKNFIFFAGGLTVFADGKDMDLFRFTQAFRKFFFLKAGIAFPL